jgi:hypothetical protein
MNPKYKALARKHWTEWLPKKVEALKAKGLLDQARRLLLGQTTLQNEFPDYRYGRADWLREQEPSK